MCAIEHQSSESLSFEQGIVKLVPVQKNEGFILDLQIQKPVQSSAAPARAAVSSKPPKPSQGQATASPVTQKGLANRRRRPGSDADDVAPASPKQQSSEAGSPPAPEAKAGGLLGKLRKKLK